VHRRLLRSYKGAVRADILAIGVFLIYVNHWGDLHSPARPLSIFRNGSYLATWRKRTIFCRKN
jgi:hypothetical protein